MSARLKRLLAAQIMSGDGPWAFASLRQEEHLADQDNPDDDAHLDSFLL